MPSKFKKAIGAVKDHTSISLAKVSNSSNSANLEVTVLKATSHDVVPIDDKYVYEILSLISSSKSNAAACATAIAKRIGKTRNWIVALKSLMLVLRIFQDGDPYFPIEVLHAMKRGAKILNLSNFRDDSTSCPWDYTAFVRSFALYLDERLDCFLTGKLQRRFTYQRDQDCIIVINNNNQRGHRGGVNSNNEPVVRDMKPAMLLDRIQFWQKLLDRAMATFPSGAAKTNRLVLIFLYAIVQETYDLYRDISDGLALLLDSFFQLQYQSCLNAFHACVKASKQFEELSRFYGTCKGLGVGRTSEYPSVQKISEEMIETLQEFLKDQASVPQSNVKGSTPGSEIYENAVSEPMEGTVSERGSMFSSACTSLEDLMSLGNTKSGASPSWSEEQSSEKTMSPLQSPLSEFPLGTRSSKRLSQSSPHIDLLDMSPPQQTDQAQQQLQQEEEKQQESQQGGDNQDDANPGWELVLFGSTRESSAVETSPIASPSLNLFASPSTNNMSPNLLERSSSPDLDFFFQQSSTNKALNQYNPFLDDNAPMESYAVPTSNETSTSFGMRRFEDDLFSFPSTSQASASPTFCAQSSDGSNMTPTFSVHSPKQRTMLPTFSVQSPKQCTISPTFSAQNSNERTGSPRFCTQDTVDRTGVPTFQASNLKENAMTPTFVTQNPKGSLGSPTFCAQNTNQSRRAPTFQADFTMDRTMELSFGAEKSKESTMSPTFIALTPREESAAPSFCADEPNASMAAPTFSTRSWEKEKPREFGSPFAVQNDDPFGPFSSVTHTSEPMCNGTTNQEAVLHQQRLWLEQQSKIIAKHWT